MSSTTTQDLLKHFVTGVKGQIFNDKLPQCTAVHSFHRSFVILEIKAQYSGVGK